MKTITKLFSLLVLLALAFSILGVTPAHAAGIRYVTPTGTGDCSSWAAACSLQTALTGAASDDEIWVVAGTYKPTADPADRTATFQLVGGVALYGGFVGTETARDQRDWTANVTSLSGDLLGNDSGFTNNAENSYHVVTGATGATIDGFTVAAGNANGSYPNDYGGGMYNNTSSPTLTNVTISGNSATDYGGGMSNLSNSSPTLTNVTFSGNSASYGGGMFNFASSPSLTNITFSGNSADYGGGMYNNTGSPTLTNVTFSGNLATFGGGMYNYTSSPTLTNATFNGNSATTGGGMSNKLSSSPTIRNSIFWGEITGGEIYNSSSVPVLSDSVVQGGYAGGTNIITADPLLGVLGNYGGFTQTIPLLTNSPAIDAAPGNCPATDQRGQPRSQPACDLGAFEFQTALLAVPGGKTSGLCASWADGCELRYALTNAVSGQEIWAKAGIYKPTDSTTDRAATFHLKGGVALYGGFVGMETAPVSRNPATNITILSGDIDSNDSQNPITDLTTVTGNTTNSYHVVTGTDGATIDGFTITAGYGVGGTCPGTGCGGGMYNNASSPNVTNINFSGNSTQLGGGMYNINSSSPILADITFSGNSAVSGGGGLYNMTSSNPTVINVTFNGNSAKWGGGGIFNLASSPVVVNVTLIGNLAPNGGGVFNVQSSPAIRNSILWGDTGGEIYNYDSSSIPVISNSVVQGGYADGTNIITTDPLLGALGNFGGFTQTIPLLPGSSAIDAATANCPVADQRGVTRDTTCDIGAFESQGFMLTKTGGDNQSVYTGTAFAPLTVNVSSAFGEPVDGGQVTFTEPGTGASVFFAGNPNVIIVSGAASISATANGTAGSYNVTASANGASNVDFALTNLSSPPTAVTSTATLITASTATMNGTVNANDSSTTVTFEYGETISYGFAVTADQSPVTGSADTAVSKAITGLLPNTTYHFRVVAQNAGGTAQDNDLTFKTLPMTERAKNGGFETYTGTSKIPKDWKAVKFGALDGKDLLVKKIGKASMKIVGAGTAIKTLTQTLLISGPAGQAFTLSYWVKGSKLPKTGICQGQVLFYNGAAVAYTQTIACPTAATYAWKQMKASFTAPTAYTKVVVKITFKKASGTVWFDGVSLMK